MPNGELNVEQGVAQGGFMSPSIFNVFMDKYEIWRERQFS